MYWAYDTEGLNTYGSDLCHRPINVEIPILGSKLDHSFSLSESFSSLKMLRTPSSESMSVLMSPYASSLSAGKVSAWELDLSRIIKGITMDGGHWVEQGIPSRVDRLLAQRSAQKGVTYRHDFTPPVHQHEYFRPNNMARTDSRDLFVSTSPLTTLDDELTQRKLIIVSNRLPVSLRKCL